jgi:DNA-binding Xre family transcriptional regulator
MKSLQFYKSFDEIPAWNFLNFLESPKVDLLIVGEHNELTEKEIETAFDSWNGIFQEFINYVGIGEKTLSIMKQEDKIIRLKIDLLVKGKKHLSAVIAMEQKKLNELRKGNEIEKDNIYQETALISKYMGFNVNIKKISAKEYFSFVKIMKHG